MIKNCLDVTYTLTNNLPMQVKTIIFCVLLACIGEREHPDLRRLQLLFLLVTQPLPVATSVGLSAVVDAHTLYVLEFVISIMCGIKHACAVSQHSTVFPPIPYAYINTNSPSYLHMLHTFQVSWQTLK